MELQTTAKEAVCATGKAITGFQRFSRVRVPVIRLEQGAEATLP